MHDLWRAGYLRRPLAEVALGGGATAGEIVWLPSDGPFRFAADPFPIVRDGVVTVFFEAFDYRIGRGEIRYRRFDAEDRPLDGGVALAEPWHLSYPQLIEDGGELYLLPEGYRSGALILYRCVRFPDRWEPVSRLLDHSAIDATVVRHDGRWWMFHALPGAQDRAVRELHLACADALVGPWTAHPANPVMTGTALSRPGGSPFVVDGALHLPVQDCTTAYGTAINVLRIESLTPRAFAARPVARLEPGTLLADFSDGLHTLSGHEDVTCLDVKALRRSPAEGWMRAQAKLRRACGMDRPTRRSAGPADRADPRPVRAPRKDRAGDYVAPPIRGRAR